MFGAPYLALAVPGLFMNAIEWWSWDLNTVLAGLCAKATLELDAQTFLSNTYLFFYSVACLWARGAATGGRKRAGSEETKRSGDVRESDCRSISRCRARCGCGFQSQRRRGIFGVFQGRRRRRQAE